MSSHEATPSSDEAYSQRPEAYQQNLRAAERAHDFRKEYLIRANEAAVKIAESAVKAVLVVNGGAALSLLAFIGGLTAQGRVQFKDLSVFANCLIWFACGVVCAALMAGLAYAAMYCSVERINRRQAVWHDPYVEETSISKRWWTMGMFFFYATILVWITSIVVFVGGMLSVRHAILQWA